MAWTKTKTAIIASIGVVLVIGIVVGVKKIPQLRQQRQQRQQARVEDLKANGWPEERKAEIERIKDRQQVDETVNATTIDLRPHITAELTEAPLCWKGNNDDNLAEVPSGRHIFAGVPFNVTGSVQLMGGWLKRYHKTYPPAANGIRIDRNCTRLHLLHGNAFIVHTNFGTVVANLGVAIAQSGKSVLIIDADLRRPRQHKLFGLDAATGLTEVVANLVVHYVDGSARDLKLVAGENAFDWWAPLFKSGIPPRLIQSAPGTERAWTGSNAHIRKWQPELSLVLYRTTFDNPQPDLKIATVDYVSTETITCPFLVGLTVE